MTATAVDVPRVRADLLYWGRLDPDATKATPEAQRYRFEGVLPVPVDTLHLIQARLPDGTVVMAGIEPDRLRSYLANRGDITPSTWEVLPDRLPAHITAALSPADGDAVIAKLNLLHGPFEPETRRVLRQRISWVLHGGVVLAALLAAIGVERRASALHTHTEQVRTETRRLLTGVVPLQPGDRHPELRLTMELRRLEQAASGKGTSGMDPIAALSAVWRVWPAALRTQIDAISALPDRLVLRGTVPTLAEAELLAQACRSLEADLRLRVQPLQAQVTDRGATFLLTLVHRAAP
jgi:hypothetical protein